MSETWCCSVCLALQPSHLKQCLCNSRTIQAKVPPFRIQAEMFSLFIVITLAIGNLIISCHQSSILQSESIFHFLLILSVASAIANRVYKCSHRLVSGNQLISFRISLPNSSFKLDFLSGIMFNVYEDLSDHPDCHVLCKLVRSLRIQMACHRRAKSY